jgi:uncharacterized protein with HEPN domain
MQRDDIFCVNHVMDAAKKALELSKAHTREDMDSHDMLSLSLVRLLEIIGEAATGVSSGFRERYPDVPWKRMVELRNRLIHGYFDINLDIVWDTVVKDLPPLIAALENVLKKEG